MPPGIISRRTKVYAILESEMDHICAISISATVFLMLASACAAVWVSLGTGLLEVGFVDARQQYYVRGSLMTLSAAATIGFGLAGLAAVIWRCCAADCFTKSPVTCEFTGEIQAAEPPEDS